MGALESDKRIVLTLDAGGTNFRFCAMRGLQPVTPTTALPSCADDLDRCLNNIIEGFERVRRQCARPPVAISFAFPGPADYEDGIIGDLPNLPAFRGGVALGPLLEERFGIPVFINNDGDLFTYGEAMAGFLPYVNGLLAAAGNPKRYHNLLGVTLGTGLGGGIVRNGELFRGDNSAAGEMWLLRNKLDPLRNAEEGASIRAVRRVYAERAGMALDDAPEPKEIFAIGMGKRRGHRAAAREAFRRLGEVAGDAMANALTLVDGLAVIGGGISGAAPLFLPALVDELNGTYIGPDGRPFRRLIPTAFNLEDPRERRRFVGGKVRKVRVPGTRRTVRYDADRRIGVGLSRLGTSRAIAIGAYAFALKALDQNTRSSR
ncbi:MAG TPA: ROK family protein [Verrucomicrobia bacterium]|nr:ROK family protein [Verrucomicrobiota bacterium]HOB33620.1 ROK family protein [Verrucomicrobiota bacterium]HOP96465.1 ROK family protein [Verrucomicrobiota bacterium]